MPPLDLRFKHCHREFAHKSPLRASPADIVSHSQGAATTQPSALVQTREDATIDSSKQLSLQSLNLDSSFPRRPGYGTQGKKITLCANYFELQPPTDLPLYRYSLTHLSGIDGKVLAGPKGRWVIQLLLQLHFAESLDSIVTDYR